MKTALQQLNQIIGTSTDKIPINFIKSKIELLLEDKKKTNYRSIFNWCRLYL